MKLKYYLRGMGIGIILTAIVMGFALGGRKGSISDAEIIQRAKALGMVEADQGPLTNTQNKEEDNSNDASTSDQTLDQEGKEISQEEQQEVPVSDTSVSEVDEETQEGDNQAQEAPEADGEDSTETQEFEETDAVGSNSGNEPEAGESQVASVQETNSESAQEQTAETVTETATNTTTSGKSITIPGGIGSDQVAQILYNEGIVDNAVSFNRYLIDRGVDRIIRSGTKVIPEGSTYEQVANIITRG